jgi:membrane-associated phospholipid phosphatase
MRYENRPLGDVHRRGRTTPCRLKTDSLPSRLRALAVSGGLSLFFLVIYGGCLWITAHRHDVGVFYFTWERAIPFVPFFILPYLSIDLFFVAAPFLFRSERRLRVYGGRVAAAIALAGICFLALPLRFAFPRPRAEGWLGALFDCFRGMDAPNNLFPSLHAALLVFLIEAYAWHLRGLARILVMSWFALVALSPLLTHQHHLIDILGGFALAAGCGFAIREKFPLDPVPRNH